MSIFLVVVSATCIVMILVVLAIYNVVHDIRDTLIKIEKQNTYNDLRDIRDILLRIEKQDNENIESMEDWR